MPDIDIKITESSDSKSLVIYDDSSGWGDGITVPEASDVLVCTLNFYEDGVLFKTITTLNIVNLGQILIGPNATDDMTMTEFYGKDTLPDGVYTYDLSYTVSVGTSPLTKATTAYYSTKIIEYNINDDLLTYLVGAQAYNYRMSFPKLDEIRRRDNILFAINSAEFLSEMENVDTLITFLERIQ